MKTVRFSQVVERSGRPQVHALWVAPEKDPEFLRARKANRVMTIEPRGHGKADVGVVGFDASQERGNQILIFPKSLKPFEGRQVVGVKFDLVEQPATESAGNPADWRPPVKKHRGSRRAHASHATAPARQAPYSASAAQHPRRAEPPALRETAPEREAPGTRKAPPAEPRRKTAPAGTDTALLREVRAALKELRAGKAVAAYQRLERAAAEAAE